jgi:phage baseplate assembly protein W
MAIIVKNKFPIDNIARKAVGVDIPFNAPAVFKSNYLTRDAIKNNLTNFFSTRRGERVFNPFFGSAIYNILFENISGATDEVIQKVIKEECAQNFPFVSISSVTIDKEEDLNNLFISIKYVATNFGFTDEINITV